MTSKYVKPNLFIHLIILTTVSKSQDENDKRLSDRWTDTKKPELDFSSKTIPVSKKLDSFKREENCQFKKIDFNPFLYNANLDKSDSVIQMNRESGLYDIVSTTRLGKLVATLKEILPGETSGPAIEKTNAIPKTVKPEQLMLPKKEVPSPEKFQMLMSQVMHRENGFHKIAVPTADGFELIPADQLVRCEAEDNYTHLFLKNKTKIVACRTLKETEKQLEHFSSFVRVHNSYLVNLNEVFKYVRGEGGYLVMSDGSTVKVSRSRKESLLKYF